jgi:hypothetical protein
LTCSCFKKLCRMPPEEQVQIVDQQNGGNHSWSPPSFPP